MFETHKKIESIRKQVKNIFKRTKGKSNYKTKNTILPSHTQKNSEWTQMTEKNVTEE